MDNFDYKKYLAEGFLGHPSERESKRDFKKQFPKFKGSSSQGQDFGHPDNIVSVVDDMTLTMGEDAFIAAIFKALSLEDAKRILRVITNDSPIENELGPVDYEWLKEDLDLGHQDNEPGMIKGDLYQIGKASIDLYKALDQFDGMGEVDLPSWWQNKIFKAKEAITGAKEYLDFELNKPQIDAVVDAINEGDSDPMSNLLQTFEKAMTDKATYDEVVAELEGAPDHVKPKLMQMADEVIPEQKDGILELIDDLETGQIDPEDIDATETKEVLIQQFKEFIKVTDFAIATIRKHVNESVNEDINYDEFDEKPEEIAQTIDPEDLTYPLEYAMAWEGFDDLDDITTIKQFNDLIKAMKKTREVPAKFFDLKAEEQMGIIRQAVMYI